MPSSAIAVGGQTKVVVPPLVTMPGVVPPPQAPCVHTSPAVHAF
jgi:hypothetical protein